MNSHLPTRLGAAILLAALVLTTPTRGEAQDAAILQREESDEARLRAWMAVRASRSPDMAWLGWVAAPFGVLTAAGGITLGVLQSDIDTANGILTLPSAALVILGAFEAGLGIFIATAPNLVREEYLGLPDRPLTEREIGRLEGLLRYEAERAALMRTMSGIAGAALGLGGLGAMPLIAAYPPESTSDLAISWVIAAGAALVGLISLIGSFFESPPEADWREYQRGLMPRDVPEVAVRVTGNGLSVSF